jgi:hypothetical protein
LKFGVGLGGLVLVVSKSIPPSDSNDRSLSVVLHKSKDSFLPELKSKEGVLMAPSEK